MSFAPCQVFTERGSSDSPLPELLKELGTKHKFLLFKNAVAELQLSHQSGKLRFRLKKETGEILYTTHVSNAERILAQVKSFLSGDKTFHEHFVFFASQKDLPFDFEEAERVARVERERVEKARQRRQRFLVIGRVAAGAIAVLLIAGFAYVKTFSRVTVPQDLLGAESSVRVIYSLEQVKDAFQDSPLIDQMRGARDQGLNFSNQVYLLEQRIDQLVKSKASERARLSGLANAQLISEFPNETKALADVPADQEAVIVRNARQPAPGLNTKNLASALGISYSEALRLKWDLDTPNERVVSPGVFYTGERAKAKAAAIEAILTRFEDERPLKGQTDSLRAQLAKNQEKRTALQLQALDMIKNLGFAKPTSSWFQVQRKPCLLVFQQHGSIFELGGDRFNVELTRNGQGQQSFLDYLLQLYSPARLNK